MKALNTDTNANESITVANYATELKDRLDFAMATADDNARAQALLEILVGMKRIPEICGEVISHHRKLYIH